MITDIRTKELAYRAQNPTYDSLFSGEAEQPNQGLGENPEESSGINYDVRNYQDGLGFIDVFDYKKDVKVNGNLINKK